MAYFIPSIKRHFWCETEEDIKNIKSSPGTIADIMSTGERKCVNSEGEWVTIDVYEIPGVDN